MCEKMITRLTSKEFPTRNGILMTLRLDRSTLAVGERNPNYV